MTKAIQQSVKFKATPQLVFELYMDSKKHTAATKAPARISRKAGGRFSAHGGMVSGRNLLIVPNRMIVQAWRSVNFKSADADSILVITFRKVARGAQVDLVHVNVPVQDHAGVAQGWKKYYWDAWRRYIARGRKS